MRALRLISALLLSGSALSPADWTSLFNGHDLGGWEVVGDGLWKMMRDGTVLGQRPPLRETLREKTFAGPTEFRAWYDTQSWLYTKREFGEFDLSLEYWLRHGGNSGISIRDTSRARYAVVTPPDFSRTPSKIGYEIQLINQYPDPQPTGSIYTFVKAKTGFQIDDDWNRLEIESRNDLIRVRLNGQVVAEHPGDPARSKTGPIGLQLHDQSSVAMFRDVRVRERPARRN